MGEMDGAGTCDVLCSPWCHPAASGLWPKLAELPVTIIQVPPGGRHIPVPTVGLAASKPTLPPLVHAAGAGFFGKRSEIWLLLPRGVITVQSPWDWSDLPDSCAPEQHEHSRSLAEGRPPSLHLHRLVPRLVASSPAGNSSLCPGQEGSADPAGG